MEVVARDLSSRYLFHLLHLSNICLIQLYGLEHALFCLSPVFWSCSPFDCLVPRLLFLPSPVVILADLSFPEGSTLIIPALGFMTSTSLSIQLSSTEN